MWVAWRLEKWTQAAGRREIEIARKDWVLNHSLLEELRVSLLWSSSGSGDLHSLAKN